jgi:hypothetical protein
MFDYIAAWYNARCLHSNLGYLNTADYRALIDGTAKKRVA